MKLTVLGKTLIKYFEYFKMKHVKNSLLKSIFFSAVTFFVLDSTCVYSGELNEQQMIDALKPKIENTSRTRSLRNLNVERTGADISSNDPAPSLSLTIGFEFNSNKLSAESMDSLMTLSKALNSEQLKELQFRIEGHTDSKGKSDYNLKLSQLRAEAVKSFLEKNGVIDSRMIPEGKGDKELINRDDKFAAENRRVQIVTLTKK
jgi:outer membrane protein OmpA-like peptidoglycan-associated protein